MSHQHYHTVQLDDLVIGSTALVELLDENGRVMIPQGMLITAALIENVRRGGVIVLHVPGIHDPTIASVQDSVSSADAVEGYGKLPYAPSRVQRLQERFHACEQLIDQLSGALRQGETIYGRELEEHVDAYTEELLEDPDAVIASALQYQSDLTLARRCVQLSLLGMAMAIVQKRQPREVQELGTAALMHDWSLFSLVPEARFPHFRMSEPLRQAYTRHPLASEALLFNVRGTTAVQRCCVAQVHELLNGTGFPRGVSGREIHPLARILSVADGFLTLTSPPNGFVRILPCDAVAYLIAGASKGRYAPAAVTALLEAVTLYPIGSILELNDATLVRVIRSNGSDFGYPVVQLLSEPQEVIDLRASELFVTRPVSEHDEARLPDAYKELNSVVDPTHAP